MWTYVCCMEAEVTFLGRVDLHRPPPFLFSGYRNSHVHFPATEPYDNLVDFELYDRETLTFGESGRVRMQVMLNAIAGSAPAVRPGDAFYAFVGDDRVLEGVLNAVGTIATTLPPYDL